MSYTIEQLDNLKAAYASGVLKVRNGDDWVEYNSMREMRLAIIDMEADIKASSTGGRPRGPQRVMINRGYNGG